MSAAPWDIKSAVRLSTIGSRSVTVEVQPGVLDESVLALRFGLFGGPLAVAFTADEARWLQDQIAARLAAEEAKEKNAMQEICSHCGEGYPAPVSLHHAEDECEKYQADAPGMFMLDGCLQPLEFDALGDAHREIARLRDVIAERYFDRESDRQLRDRVVAHATEYIRVNESIPRVDEADEAYGNGYVKALVDLIEWMEERP